jgi:hypothetical protein
MCFADYNFKN